MTTDNNDHLPRQRYTFFFGQNFVWVEGRPAWRHRKILKSPPPKEPTALEGTIPSKKDWKLAGQLLDNKQWKCHVKLGRRSRDVAFRKLHPSVETHSQEESHKSRASSWGARGSCPKWGALNLGTCPGQMGLTRNIERTLLSLKERVLINNKKYI